MTSSDQCSGLCSKSTKNVCWLTLFAATLAEEEEEDRFFLIVPDVVAGMPVLANCIISTASSSSSPEDSTVRAERLELEPAFEREANGVPSVQYARGVSCPEYDGAIGNWSTLGWGRREGFLVVKELEK